MGLFAGLDEMVATRRAIGVVKFIDEIRSLGLDVESTDKG